MNIHNPIKNKGLAIKEVAELKQYVEKKYKEWKQLTSEAAGFENGTEKSPRITADSDDEEIETAYLNEYMPANTRDPRGLFVGAEKRPLNASDSDDEEEDNDEEDNNGDSVKRAKQSKTQTNLKDVDEVPENWALPGTVNDADTLHNYSHETHLQPQQAKNAVYLMLKMFLNPQSDMQHYTCKDTDSIFPNLVQLILAKHTTIMLSTKAIALETGLNAMNILTDAMTSAILVSNVQTKQWKDLNRHMGGNPRGLTSETRLTCSAHPEHHILDIKKIIPNVWKRDYLVTPSISCGQVGCGGYIIIQKKDSPMAPWRTVYR